MDWLGIIVAGLAGTAAITVIMYSAPMMGMAKMDIAQMLGSMFLPQGSTAFALGMMMHFMNGVIFAIIYGLVWEGLDVDVTWWSGLIFGAVHFLVAMVGMAMMMFMHKEVKAGRMENPTKAGPKGIIGSLMGHMLFGLVVALVYGAFV
ncbi:MAG: hypothetical protein FJ320_02600 [SAR202 cluster bacterium]|nr:hypothetical protein [SAR202 cluster bacterium]